MPPRSSGSIRFVIKLLMLGCKMPPPMAAGTMATNSQASPSQPVLASLGSVATMPVVGGVSPGSVRGPLSSACILA